LSEEEADLGLVFLETPDSGLLLELREICRSIPRVLAVALAKDPLPAERCGQILQAGAADILWWHGSRTIARDILDRLQRWNSIEDDLRSSMVRDHMVGQSPAWSAVLRELIEIARFSPAPCLLQGESGTGKELAARLIHTLDGREDKGDLVVVDCSTIVPEL
jgi:DNA-binding NtrC family response regulator